MSHPDITLSLPDACMHAGQGDRRPPDTVNAYRQTHRVAEAVHAFAVQSKASMSLVGSIIVLLAGRASQVC